MLYLSWRITLRAEPRTINKLTLTQEHTLLTCDFWNDIWVRFGILPWFRTKHRSAHPKRRWNGRVWEQRQLSHDVLDHTDLQSGVDEGWVKIAYHLVYHSLQSAKLPLEPLGWTFMKWVSMAKQLHTSQDHHAQWHTFSCVVIRRHWTLEQWNRVIWSNDHTLTLHYLMDDSEFGRCQENAGRENIQSN